MSELKAIFFDIDDTLYSTSEFAATARRNAMEAMIEHVRSPGGTTSAAFEVFDNENVRDIFAAAFTAARDRSRELAEGDEK